MIVQNFNTLMDALKESIYKGNFSGGANTLARWLQEDLDETQYLDVQSELILLALVCGDLEDAEQRWHEIRGDVDTANHPRYAALSAYFLMTENRREQALKIFESCLLAEPNNFEFYLLRGLGYAQCEQYEHAQADFDRANALSPNNVLILSSMGDVCIELGERERAVALHESVLEACPDFRRSLTSLGVLFCDLGQLDDSFRLFQCLVGYDSINWFAWTCLGDIISTRPGQSYQALLYYAAAIATGSEQAETYITFIKGLMSLGYYDTARNMFRKFEKRMSWEPKDLFTVNYLKLVCDVVLHPEIESQPEFERRFKDLTPHNDRASRILFETLAGLAKLDYCGDIVQIFAIHMTGFFCIANYLTLCERRIIIPEEAVLIGVLAHMYIWNGFGFESRALLNLLSGAEDPRVIDMMYVLWSELYERDEIAFNAGIRYDLFHEKLVKESDSELEFRKFKTGKIEKLTGYLNWRNSLLKFNEIPESSDFVRALFDFPFESVLSDLEIEIGNDNPMRSEILAEFWGIYEQWTHLSKDKQDVSEFWKTQKKSVSKKLLILLKKLSKLDIPVQTDALSYREKLDLNSWRQVFKAVHHKSTEITANLEIVPDNDNLEQASAASLEEALSGFDPLPFALDGTAFKRLMHKTREDYHLLESASSDELMSSLVRRSLQTMMRGQSNEAINATVEPTILQEKLKGIKALWKTLHGVSPISRPIIESARKEHLDELLRRVTGNIDSCTHLMGAENCLSDEGVLLPKSPCVSVSMWYKYPELPKFPKGSACYAQPLPGNFLTHLDLTEQFFNYAVNTIESWFETGDNHLLKIFLNDGMVRFKKFLSRPRYRAGNRVHLEVSDAVSHDKLFVKRESAYNSDTEHKKIRTRGEMTGHAPAQLDPTRIYLIHEMADSLTQLRAWAKSSHLSLFSSNVNTGYRKHPFLEQFHTWAEKHADALWMDIARIEEQIRYFEVASQYTIIWQIHDILNRWPFLSRVYVLLAGVYARMGEEEKALQAIQTGLQWEDKLYKGVGWYPIHPSKEDPERETAFEPITAETELGDSQYLLWPERYVLLPRDEAMYHYGSLERETGMRCRIPYVQPMTLLRVVWNDKGGCFDFYRLFRKFISMTPALRDVYLKAIYTQGVHSLRDYMVYIITNMVAPESFPLRRQIAELLFQLYPRENPGAIGRFYCDNVQPSNALPYTAFAQFSRVGEDGVDDSSLSTVTLGCLLYDIGAMEEGMEYLDRASNSDTPSSMALLTKGCALIEMREFDKALECLKKGQKIDPSSDRFFYNMSLVYIETNRLDEAEQAIQAGIALSKFPVDLNLQLMRVYVRRGQMLEALPIARYIANEDPEYFLSLILYPEFEEFRELPAVQAMLDECSYIKK